MLVSSDQELMAGAGWRPNVPVLCSGRREFCNLPHSKNKFLFLLRSNRVTRYWWRELDEDRMFQYSAAEGGNAATYHRVKTNPSFLRLVFNSQGTWYILRVNLGRERICRPKNAPSTLGVYKRHWKSRICFYRSAERSFREVGLSNTTTRRNKINNRRLSESSYFASL